MSILTRPSVVFAIVFACFAVLIPRVFLPLLRPKPSAPAHQFDDHFRRPHPAVARQEHGDRVEHIPGSPPHMRGAHPGMRMHHPGANGQQQQAAADTGSSKSIVTLALPMYTVGIGVFFVYTCCKYWSKKQSKDNTKKSRQGNDDPRWMNKKKRKVQYDMLDKDSEGEENKEDFYGGLEPDYVEYLKSKKQKALEAERAMTDEQKQMHYALEEMKKSLSFISSKLVTKESRGNLNGNEIVQLQERLASTESQMCKILTALDAASDKVNDTTKTTIESPKEKEEEEEEEEEEEKEEHHSTSKSSSDDEDNVNEEENVSLADEYDSQNPSESLSSSNISLNEDQSAPTDEDNRFNKRKYE